MSAALATNALEQLAEVVDAPKTCECLHSGEECGKPAKWLTIPPCGCAPFYQCAPCKELLAKSLALLDPTSTICTNCFSRHDWRLLRWEPLP